MHARFIKLAWCSTSLWSFTVEPLILFEKKSNFKELLHHGPDANADEDVYKKVTGIALHILQMVEVIIMLYKKLLRHIEMPITYTITE